MSDELIRSEKEVLVEKFCNSPVYALPIAFDLDRPRVRESYLNFLIDGGVKTIMTTAGTSSFNKLTPDELFNANLDLGKTGGVNKVLGLHPASTEQCKGEVERLNQFNLKDTALILLYPDRYYDDQMIVDYFHSIASISIYPIFIHGMYMRRATGGMYDFETKLIKKLKEHPKIIGIKEETKDLARAFSITNKCASNEFGFIVAGGSQKRFFYLHPAGAHTFLTGVGNLIPEIDIEFFNKLKNNEYEAAIKLTEQYESKLFDVFMEMGWHKALGIAMEHFYEYPPIRSPKPNLSEEDRVKVVDVVMKIKSLRGL